MYKNVSIKALKDGAIVAGMGLKANQIVSLDLSGAQIKEAKANPDLAVDDSTDGSGDLSLVSAPDASSPSDNAPKANGPMYGVGIVEKVSDSAQPKDDPVTDAASDDAAKSSKSAKSK